MPPAPSPVGDSPSSDLLSLEVQSSGSRSLSLHRPVLDQKEAASERTPFPQLDWSILRVSQGVDTSWIYRWRQVWDYSDSHSLKSSSLSWEKR